MADEYLFPVGIEAKNEGFAQINAQLDAIEAKSVESRDAMTKAFSDSAKAADSLEREIAGVGKVLTDTTQDVNQLEKEMQGLANETKKIDNASVNRFRSAWDGALKFIRNGRTTVSEFFKGVKEGVNDAVKDMNRLEKTVQKTNKQLRDANGRFTGGGGSSSGRGGGGGGSILGQIASFATGGLIANGITGILNGLRDLGNEVITTAAKFQRFEAILRNAFGSTSEAQEAMKLINDFAADTPFEVDELTDAFVKLVNRGFKPTREELTQIGDLASSQGKSLDQLVEAILDAQTGEFERLKEFGITARTIGNDVTLAFKGIETQVKKTDREALRDAVISFGKLNGVAGSMAAISKTLGGQLSNLSDSISAVFRNIGEQSSGLLSAAVSGLSRFVNLIKEATEVPFEQTVRRQQAELNSLVNALALANDNEALRSRIITEISQKYPEFLKLINAESANTDQLTSALQRMNQQYENKIRLAGLDARSTEVATKQQDLFNKQLDALQKLAPALQQIGITTADFLTFDEKKQQEVIKQAIDAAKKQFASEADAAQGDFIARAAAERNARRLQLEMDAVAEQLLGFDQAFNQLTVDQQVIQEQRSALTQKEIDQIKEKLAAEEQNLKVAERLAELAANGPKLAKETADATLKAQRSLVAGLKQQLDVASGVTPTAAPTSAPLTEAELAKRAAAQKKLEDLERRKNDQLIKLAQQLRDAELTVLEDGYEKQRKAIEDSYKKRIEDVQKEKALTEQAAKQQTALVVALEKARGAELERLRLDQIRKEAELQNEAAKIRAEFSPNSPEKQKAVIDAEFDAREAAIKERFRNEIALRDELLAQLQAGRATAKGNVDISSVLINIDQQEKQSLESLELLRKYGNNTVKQERAIQAQILQVKIQAAEASLRVLTDAGKGENDEQVKNFRTLLGSLNAELKAFQGQAPTENMDIFDLFGLDLNEQEKAQIEQSFRVVMDSLTSIWENSLNRQLDLKQRQIDLIDDQISKLEEQFSIEKELADQGLANNLAVVQAELDAKKAAREKEQKDLEEIQKKQNKAAQAQIAVNGILQLSNLALSATQIFAAHSGIPFVGVAFAIAAVATMFATFAAMKAKAAELSKPQKFSQGGFIGTGKDHAQGGIKYYSDNGDVKELQVGEYVTNRDSTAKHRQLLEAINEDNLPEFARHNTDWLVDLLAGTGVSLPGEKRREGLRLATSMQRAEMGHRAAGDSMNERVERIEQHVAYIAAAKRTEKKVYETDTHIVTETPGRITRKRKQK